MSKEKKSNTIKFQFTTFNLCIIKKLFTYLPSWNKSLDIIIFKKKMHIIVFIFL